MAKEPNPIDNSNPGDEEPSFDEATDTDLDLLTNQTTIIASHILSEGQIPIDNQQLEFVQFLRLIKGEDQHLALSELYTEFELILTLQNNIDSLDENDPLGRQSLENSAKKTQLLLESVTRVLNHILRIKPEVHYIKETHRLRKSTPLPVDEYYRLKSPDLDLIKAYTNFDQLKMLLANSVHNRQVFDLLDTLNERIFPQFKEFLKGKRRREQNVLTELPVEDDESGDPRHIRPDAESLLRQTIISLTNTFLKTHTPEPALPGCAPELAANLREIYRSLSEFQETDAARLVEEQTRPLQKLIEESLITINRASMPSLIQTPEADRDAFLLNVAEYLTHMCNALDSFFEQYPGARQEESYMKRLEMARGTVKHVRAVMREEHYQEKAQLPFLNLKSFVYFAVKVIKDLNYFNPALQRKFRYYIERNVLDARLQEAIRKIPKENRIERRYVITALLEINRMMRIISSISPNRDDLTDYQLTYYWFRLVEKSLHNLITFIKSYPADEPLANGFDSMAFTLEMEAERVFGKRGHLAQLNEQSPIEEYIKRVEDSIGILGRVLLENYIYLAQTYLPHLTREDLDKDYKERVTATLLLREHTWCIWQICSMAEQQLKSHIEDGTPVDLNIFMSGLLRRVQMYLMKFLPKVFYSDRVELKRTFNDLFNCAALLTGRKGAVTPHHLHQLHERIHVLTTLFASLAENIKNRSILEGRPFNQETAMRTLQKYQQTGTPLS